MFGPYVIRGVSWLVIVLGLLVGTLSIVLLCKEPVFVDGYPAAWESAGAFAILSFGSLAASVDAMKNPRRAGLILITAAAFGLFFMGFPAILVLPGLFWLFAARSGWQGCS